MTTRANHRPPLGLYPNHRRDLLALATGLHHVSVTRILRGQQGVSEPTLDKLAEALRVNKSDLARELLTERERRKAELLVSDAILDLL